jgi:secreted trypsin-like serine protease
VSINSFLPAGCSSCGLSNAGSRIIGGSTTSQNQYPWLVGLLNGTSNTPFCGGSILTNNIILTAAHCCKAMDLSRFTFRVVGGEFDTSVASGSEVMNEER